MKNNLFPISHNGYKYIIYALVASIIFSLLDFTTLSFISFILIFLFVYLFRNPERAVSVFDADSVVSPVDGKIIAVEDLEKSDEYGYKVVVQSTYFDIGVLRAPFDSNVENIAIKNGSRLSVNARLSNTLNAHTELVFKSGKFNKVKVRHIVTQSFASLYMSIFKSQSIRQSLRYGFMLHGYTEIYIPKNFRLNVQSGQKVKASESLLGFFIAIP